MAVLDLERDAVVIRIVYDGPPFAGKTTSMRALARSLGRSIDSPGETAGRTVFFDWMEYTGGLFDGHQIHCQIVSVPGHGHLASRRRALLDSADVVVFVADTSDRIGFERSLERVRDLAEILRGHGDPPIGMVVQANKRDLPGALPRDELRAALGDDFARVALTESVAGAGEGIRETFVFAVRLALDRIRELMARGALPRGKPTVDTSRDLLGLLEQLLPAVPDRPPAPPERPAAVLARPPPTAEQRPPPMIERSPAVAPGDARPAVPAVDRQPAPALERAPAAPASDGPAAQARPPAVDSRPLPPLERAPAPPASSGPAVQARPSAVDRQTSPPPLERAPAAPASGGPAVQARPPAVDSRPLPRLERAPAAASGGAAPAAQARSPAVDRPTGPPPSLARAPAADPPRSPPALRPPATAPGGGPPAVQARPSARGERQTAPPPLGARPPAAAERVAPPAASGTAAPARGLAGSERQTAPPPLGARPPAVVDRRAAPSPGGAPPAVPARAPAGAEQRHPPLPHRQSAVIPVRPPQPPPPERPAAARNGVPPAGQARPVPERSPAAAPAAAASDIASAVRSVMPAARPRLPDARVPSGTIWPPVEGRMVLHEATSYELTVQRAGADWVAGLGTGWRLHSAASASFDDFDDGRQTLLAWARLHAAHGELLSPSRCVVLAAADDETWRLWQIVKIAPALRAWLLDVETHDAADLIDRLASAAAALADAYRRLADHRLVLGLDTVGLGPRGVQFVALMPGPDTASPPRPADVTEHIVRELTQVLAGELANRRSELAARIARRRPVPSSAPWDDLVAAAITNSVPPTLASVAPH